MDIQKQVDKFVPVKVGADKEAITPKLNAFIEELVKAGRFMDEIFLRQAYSGNVRLREEFENSSRKGGPEHEYFKINGGPYDRLEHYKPFVSGVPPRPDGAQFYPDDITKEEFEAWIKDHPQDKDAFEGTFTVIRRKGDGLVSVPYSEEYREWLIPAAGHLKKAAALMDNVSLKKYLLSRADAFLSNDYFQSDCDWVHLENHKIEVVMGPYETYEDNLFCLKAAFQAFIAAVDEKESERLSKLEGFMSDFERILPVEDEYKGIGRNLESPISVVQTIYTSGDANKGIQLMAFNLPNDEKVRKQEGSKKVMSKNVQKAKFDKILVPVARIMTQRKDADDVAFEAFFAHSLMHEISHGIGPSEYMKGGVAASVIKELKELYMMIEECKADTLSVHNSVFLVEKGFYPKGFENSMWPTYLANIFRSMRFGIAEAHGSANAIQFNYILEKGGFQYDVKTGLYSVDRSKIVSAVHNLAHDLIMIQANGGYLAAKEFVAKYRIMPPELEKAMEKLNELPVDIRPVYEYE